METSGTSDPPGTVVVGFGFLLAAIAVAAFGLTNATCAKASLGEGLVSAGGGLLLAGLGTWGVVGGVRRAGAERAGITIGAGVMLAVCAVLVHGYVLLKLLTLICDEVRP